MKARFLCIATISIATATSLMAQTTDTTSAAPTASAPAAQHGRWAHHRGGFFHELKQLNLTDAQKQQVHQIFASNKAAFRTGYLNLLNAKKALAAAIAQNPDDQTAIQTLATNQGNAIAALTVQHAAVRSQIVKILTTEQKAQLTQIDAKHQNRLQQRIDRMSQSNA